MNLWGSRDFHLYRFCFPLKIMFKVSINSKINHTYDHHKQKRKRSHSPWPWPSENLPNRTGIAEKSRKEARRGEQGIEGSRRKATSAHRHKGTASSLVPGVPAGPAGQISNVKPCSQGTFHITTTPMVPPRVAQSGSSGTERRWLRWGQYHRR